MKKKIKKLVMELGAFLLLTLVLSISTISTTVPSITGNITTEDQGDAVETNSDDPDRPKKEPNLDKT